MKNWGLPYPGIASIVAGLFALFAVTAAHSGEYYDNYALVPGSKSVDIGIQPLGFPSGVISAVMVRDKILRRTLEKLGRPLLAHPFRRGADMIGLIGDQRLDAGLLGDMPTILSATTGTSVIVGLVKQTSTALVARDNFQVQQLRGKRIGYVEASSAHHTVLQGLATAGLSESDVTLVNLRIEEMPAALERGDIDAFAGWEPAPSTALTLSDKNRIVFRGQSTDYFLLNRQFADNHSEASLHIVAAFLRAINWMRRSKQNLALAVEWTIIDGERFSQTKARLSTEQLAAITRRDILDVPAAPAIVRRGNIVPLQKQFDFLAGLGKLPASASLENLKAAFAFEGLAKVSRQSQRYELDRFDYGP